MVAAARYLEENNYNPPADYFADGGTLSALALRVQELIDNGTFDNLEADDHFRERVHRQLRSAVSYIQKNPSRSVTSVWRRFIGLSEDSEWIPDAQKLLRILGQPNFSSADPEIIFAPGRSFEQIIADVVSKVINTQRIREDRALRARFRAQLYEKAKEEWERQAATVAGYLRWFLDTVVSAVGVSPSLRSGISCLQKLDEYEGELGHVDRDRCLCLSDALWLDDVLLIIFARERNRTEYLLLKGSVRLTAKGIERAKSLLVLCRAVCMPNGRIWRNPDLDPRAELPAAFKGFEMQEEEGFVVVQRRET